MTHTELRIGNWVMPLCEQRGNSGYLGSQVAGIGFNGEINLFCDHQNGASALNANAIDMTKEKYLIAAFLSDDVTGIPLDKGWLERFGFVLHDHSAILGRACLSPDLNHPEVGGEYFCLTRAEKTWCLYFGPEIDSRLDIQYVHQLQNLYFALTGQELEINTTKL